MINYIELIKSILSEKNLTSNKLNTLKIDFCKKYKLLGVVKNPVLIANCPNDLRDDLIRKLNIKPIRELSGVTVLALFTKPHKCPHGKCIYCPGGVGSPFGDTPQSYTGREPAAQRAIRNHFDPYLQVFNRLEHYVINGHIPDKLEIIFMGGTFPSLEKEYKDDFVKNVYKAVNDFGDHFIEVKKEIKPLKIGIDCDDVLVCCFNTFLKYYNKKYKTNVKFENQKYHDLKLYDYENFEEEFFKFHLKNLEKLTFFKGVKTNLKKIKKNHSLNVITSRLKNEKNKTKKWLSDNFGKDFFNEIIFTSDFQKDKKGLISKEKDFDIVIEDAPHHIFDYLENTNSIVFVFDRPWNKEVKEDKKRVFRVKSWDEIFSLIKKFEKIKIEKKVKWEKFIKFFELKNENLDFSSRDRQKVIHKKCLKLKNKLLN